MKPAFAEAATIFGVETGKLSGGAIDGLYKTVDTAFRPSPEHAPWLSISTLPAPLPLPVPASTQRHLGLLLHRLLQSAEGRWQVDRRQ